MDSKLNRKTDKKSAESKKSPQKSSQTEQLPAGCSSNFASSHETASSSGINLNYTMPMMENMFESQMIAIPHFHIKQQQLENYHKQIQDEKLEIQYLEAKALQIQNSKEKKIMELEQLRIQLNNAEKMYICIKIIL